MDRIKTHHDQSSRTIVRHATRNAETAVAVVAANAQITSTVKMRVSAMSHVQKGAMSVVQSVVAGQMMHGSIRTYKTIRMLRQKPTTQRRLTVAKTRVNRCLVKRVPRRAKSVHAIATVASAAHAVREALKDLVKTKLPVRKPHLCRFRPMKNRASRTSPPRSKHQQQWPRWLRHQPQSRLPQPLHPQ